MTLVRVSGVEWPDIMRQTPGGRGIWDGVAFSTTATECDYVLDINHPSATTVVRCSPDCVWMIMQEPPAGSWEAEHRGRSVYARVYTTDTRRRGRRYFHTQPAFPWFVDFTFDELERMAPPDKPKRLSWVTSDRAVLPGQRKRLAFVERLGHHVEFDLLGWNRWIPKWDGVAAYRYSIVVDNFSGPHYWSEKIADCFLAWTMPIYYGCTNIADYFPPESVVAIDIDDPLAPERVADTIAGDLWLRRRDAIAEARRRVLHTHQLFPMITREIHAFEASGARPRPPCAITLKPWPDLRERVRREARRTAGRVLRAAGLRARRA